MAATGSDSSEEARATRWPRLLCVSELATLGRYEVSPASRPLALAPPACDLLELGRVVPPPQELLRQPASEETIVQIEKDLPRTMTHTGLLKPGARGPLC